MILIKWPALQKYQQGGKPTCAIVHPTQIRSSSTSTLRVLQTNLLQVRFSSNALAGRGRTHPKPSFPDPADHSALERARSHLVGETRPLCSSGEISVCTVGGAESPCSGNRSSLHQSCAAFTKPPVPEHSLRWIESPKLGSSIQRVVTGHFIRDLHPVSLQLHHGSRPRASPLSGAAGLLKAELLGDGQGKGQRPLRGCRCCQVFLTNDKSKI